MSFFKVRYITGDPELIRKVEDFISAWHDERPYIETKTSGSTGVPKIITLDKAKMRVSAEMTGSYFGFGPGQLIMLCLSPDSIGGKMLILRAMLHDMDLLVADVARNPLRSVDHPVDFISMVPMQVQSVLAENPGKLGLVRSLLIGGAQVSPQLENALKPWSVEAYESFGMTETMSHIAVKKLNDASGDGLFQGLKGIAFSLKDEKLVIHAPALGLPALETNDIVELHGDRAFAWKGRADFAINSGGIKFHPEQLEKKLAGAVNARFFIAGEKDPLLGEKMVLIVEGPAETLSEQILWEAVKQRLNGYEVPKTIRFVPAFAETASGKINRPETLKMIQN